MTNRRVSLKGKGADLFFGDYIPDATGPAAPRGLETGERVEAEMATDLAPSPAPEPVNFATNEQTSLSARKRASKQAQSPAGIGDEIRAPGVVERVRRVVKRPGKEVVYVRLTPEEKGRLADVVYTYKRQGIRTSDNELGRIAINGLLADYEEHGERSLLARVLAALEA